MVNPYAERLTFLDDRTRTRRDHEKYLTLIDAIALLHQHQRPIQSMRQGSEDIRYIEVQLPDIALANELAHEVLGRTLDELPPQTRRLLGLIIELVNAQCAAHQIRRQDYRFTRRGVREHTRWGDTQLKIHLSSLVEMEYLAVHHGGRSQCFEYELLFDGSAGTASGGSTAPGSAPHVSGLIDVQALEPSGGEPAAQPCDAGRSGLDPARSGGGRPPVGERPGGGREAIPATIGKTSALAYPFKYSGVTLRR